eukprot:scaffold10998_cov56-Attheya_sp.AAC.2
MGSKMTGSGSCYGADNSSLGSSHFSTLSLDLLEIMRSSRAAKSASRPRRTTTALARTARFSPICDTIHDESFGDLLEVQIRIATSAVPFGKIVYKIPGKIMLGGTF